MNQQLRWSPLAETLEKEAKNRRGLQVVVAPFVSRDGAEWLRALASKEVPLQVICRWTAADLVSGIADPGIYPILNNQGASLFVHKRIHLKLYIFGDGTAFQTSANVTRRGLGIGGAGNIEVGNNVQLTLEDWSLLHSLFEESLAVDEDVYRRADAYQRAHGNKTQGELPPLVLETQDPGEPRSDAFSISNLPACESPRRFAEFNSRPSSVTSEERAAYVHDRRLFGVPEGMPPAACLQLLAKRVRAQPFIRAFTAMLRENGSLRFGAVRAWLQATCSDKPVPYRWELSSATRNLYQWLVEFYPEISWDRPNHTMVVRWKEQGGASAPTRRRSRS